jgi:hypothetical protein
MKPDKNPGRATEWRRLNLLVNKEKRRVVCYNNCILLALGFLAGNTGDCKGGIDSWKR